MKFSLWVGAVLLTVGTAMQSAAAVIETGTYSYSLVSQSSDISCTSDLRDTFTGTVSVDGEPITNAAFSFSACQEANSVDDGEYALTYVGSVVSGTVEGTNAGTVEIDSETYTVTDGDFTVATATGFFTGSTPGDFMSDSAPYVSGPNTGIFSIIIPTPEPGTTALGALGLFAFGVVKRRSRRIA